jgi:AraC-like DNA-binding protein
MADSIIQVTSISQLHQMLGFEKPKHPLVSVIDASKFKTPKEVVGHKIVSDLYWVALKDKSCGFQYGRNHYDFDEGVLIFTAPKQVMSSTEEVNEGDSRGWMLFFHPDLIRQSHLGQHIDQYSFFDYDNHEALHLSDEEEKTLTSSVEAIKKEYEQRIDNHSQRVIVSSLELMLNYCLRFYERQFNTRSSQNKDIVTTFERLLKNYFSSGRHELDGLPSIQYFAEQIHLSQPYLSDLLKKETGRTTKDHINDFVIEKAKDLLLGSSDSISEIAYTLGFNYPHYFTRLFKSKTGQTPVEYRTVH